MVMDQGEIRLLGMAVSDVMFQHGPKQPGKSALFPSTTHPGDYPKAVRKQIRYLRAKDYAVAKALQRFL